MSLDEAMWVLTIKLKAILDICLTIPTMSAQEFLFFLCLEFLLQNEDQVKWCLVGLNFFIFIYSFVKSITFVTVLFLFYV